MSPFADSQPQTKPSLLSRLTAQPALIVFLVCLLAGLGAVYWKAKVDERAARARTRAEAQARGAALQLEINQAISAAEALGTLARQYGGAIPNFQRIANDLLATRPNLASLELQPGGIVSDIAPRPAQERALRRNLLVDPAYRPGLQAALQRRGLTVTGPTTLYRGEKGLIVRVPVFQRTRDNRELVWGFVAASLRLAEAVNRAGLDQVAKHGYTYHLFVPASGQQPAASIAAQGEVSEQAEPQPIRVQNLELCLVLQPQGGWLNKGKLALEALGVLVVSGLVCLLVNLLESRNDMEGALTEANQRLARETADRKQAQEDARAVKDSAAAAQSDLKQTRLALQQAEAKLAESCAQREAAMRESQEVGPAVQARLRESELKITELQTALHQAEQAGKSRQAELTQVHAALQQAQGANEELQARIEAADQAQLAGAKLAESRGQLEAALHESQEASQAAQARLRKAELKNTELQGRLDTALAQAQQAAQTREEELTQAQAALQQAKAANDELQARLEATTRAASEVAEASAAKLKAWEETKRDLEAHLLAAEQAAAQAAQFATRVEEPETEALAGSAVVTEPEAPAAAATVASLPAEPQPEKAEMAPTPVAAVISSEPAAVEPEPAAPMKVPSETKTIAEEQQLTPVAAETSVPASNGESVSEVAPLSAPSSEVAPPTVQTSSEASVEVPAPAVPEPQAKEKPAKPAKRKKSRKVDQMDLFGGQAPAESAPAMSPAESPATGPVVEPLGLPLLDLPAPAQPVPDAPASAVQPVPPAEPEKVAAPAQEQIPVELESLIPVEPAPELAEPAPAEPVEAKPAAPAVSVSEIPAIEGLDTAEGLAQAEGNAKHYLKALRHFAEHQANLPAKIRDALVQGDSAQAEQLIQILKTAAAAIGAKAVLQAAKTLGRAVHEQSDPSGIEFSWAELDKGLGDLISDLKFLLKPREDKPAPARPLPPAPPVNPAQLRKAVHQILPLLADSDPGAKDCLKDNRATFRSAFTPEAYVEFEQLVKSAEFSVALELLKKAVRKHGVSV